MEEKFDDTEYMKPHPLLRFDGVLNCKSIWRSIRRGKASIIGAAYPKRPFNNRKPTAGRQFNEQRKDIYGRLKQRGI